MGVCAALLLLLATVHGQAYPGSTPGSGGGGAPRLADRPEADGFRPDPRRPPATASYDFNWNVDNKQSTQFGQRESRAGQSTRGSYSVLLPDGRLQTVTYTVDGDGGYVAEVTYQRQTRRAPPGQLESQTHPPGRPASRASAARSYGRLGAAQPHSGSQQAQHPGIQQQAPSRPYSSPQKPQHRGIQQQATSRPYPGPQQPQHRGIQQQAASRPQGEYSSLQQLAGRHRQSRGGSQSDHGDSQEGYAGLQQTAVRPQQIAVRPQQTAVRPQQTAVRPQQAAVRPKQSYGSPKQGYGSPKQDYGSPRQEHNGPKKWYKRPQEPSVGPPNYGGRQDSPARPKGYNAPSQDLTWTKQASTKPQDLTWTKQASTKPQDHAWTKQASTKPQDHAWIKQASTKPQDLAWTKQASTNSIQEIASNFGQSFDHPRWESAAAQRGSASPRQQQPHIRSQQASNFAQQPRQQQPQVRSQQASKLAQQSWQQQTDVRSQQASKLAQQSWEQQTHDRLQQAAKFAQQPREEQRGYNGPRQDVAWSGRQHNSVPSQQDARPRQQGYSTSQQGSNGPQRVTNHAQWGSNAPLDSSFRRDHTGPEETGKGRQQDVLWSKPRAASSSLLQGSSGWRQLPSSRQQQQHGLARLAQRHPPSAPGDERLNLVITPSIVGNGNYASGGRRQVSPPIVADYSLIRSGEVGGRPGAGVGHRAAKSW